MNLDLQEPISTIRSAAHTAAEKAADLAPDLDLGRATRRRPGRSVVLTVVALAAGLGIALWLVRRRATESAVPEIAPDPFGTGVAATDGPLVHREPAVHG